MDSKADGKKKESKKERWSNKLKNSIPGTRKKSVDAGQPPAQSVTQEQPNTNGTAKPSLTASLSAPTFKTPPGGGGIVEQRRGSADGTPITEEAKAPRGKRPRKFNEKWFNALLETLKNDSFQNTHLDLHDKYLDKYAAEDLSRALVIELSLYVIQSNIVVQDDE